MTSSPTTTIDFEPPARSTGLGTERFRQLDTYEASAAFSVPEKAALAHADAVETSFGLDDSIFVRLRGVIR